jgi:hypothetical protein
MIVETLHLRRNVRDDVEGGDSGQVISFGHYCDFGYGPCAEVDKSLRYDKNIPQFPKLQGAVKAQIVLYCLVRSKLHWKVKAHRCPERTMYIQVDSPTTGFTSGGFSRTCSRKRNPGRRNVVSTHCSPAYEIKA